MLKLGESMKIIDNIRSFLYDKDYFINIFEDYIYVFNYFDLNHFSDHNINLKLEKFNLTINGENLYILSTKPFVKKFMEKEILIQGRIEKVIKC